MPQSPKASSSKVDCTSRPTEARFVCALERGLSDFRRWAALHTGSLTQLPLADSALNGVITVNTIYFVAELDPAFTELARVVGSAGRIVVGLADPDAMARMPFTGHGFHLRSVPEVIDTLRGAGLGVKHRRISQGDDAPHLLIATPTRAHL
jgi:arsenite methyltransferase